MKDNVTLPKLSDRGVSAPGKRHALSASARGGRPTKFNGRVQGTICDALRRGCHYETAAALAGISVRTLRNLLREGARILDGEEDGQQLDLRDRRLADFYLACRQVKLRWSTTPSARSGATVSAPGILGAEIQSRWPGRKGARSREPVPRASYRASPPQGTRVGMAGLG